MPEGLAIDRKRELNGTMPPYAQHVVIHTGRNDWSSRIEDEAEEMAGEQAGGGVRRRNLAKALKGLVGRGGKFHDVCLYSYALMVLVINKRIIALTPYLDYQQLSTAYSSRGFQS